MNNGNGSGIMMFPIVNMYIICWDGVANQCKANNNDACIPNKIIIYMIKRTTMATYNNFTATTIINKQIIIIQYNK